MKNIAETKEILGHAETTRLQNAARDVAAKLADLRAKLAAGEVDACHELRDVLAAPTMNACVTSARELRAKLVDAQRELALANNAIRIANLKVDPPVPKTSFGGMTVADYLRTTGASDGAAKILIERERQKAKWSAEHDDKHLGGLAIVAGELCLGSGKDRWGLLQKHRYDRVRQLVIAGALVAAEIDRHQRAEKGTTPQ